jgi:hypothetical protein
MIEVFRTCRGSDEGKERQGEQGAYLEYGSEELVFGEVGLQLGDGGDGAVLGALSVLPFQRRVLVDCRTEHR